MKKIFLIGFILLTAAGNALPDGSPAAEAAAVQSPSDIQHQILELIDRNRLDEADALLATIRNPESGNSAAVGYLTARLAFERGNSVDALKSLSQVMIAGSRDAEWTPAAVFLEGSIHKKNGQTVAAAYVAEELVLGWPDSVWSRRAEELK